MSWRRSGDVERRSWLFFQGLLEHAAVERQLGDQELEAADLGFEFGHAKLFTRYRILLEGLPTVVGGDCDAGLAARLVDVQPGVEVGLDIAEDRGDAVRSWSFSHGSLPGSLPVVRFPLRLDQVLGGRPDGNRTGAVRQSNVASNVTVNQSITNVSGNNRLGVGV